MAEHEQGYDEQQDDSPPIRAMRKELEALKAERDTLRERERVRTFKDAGFDPNAGVGKLLARTYDGEVTVEAIKAFAEAEGLTPTAASDTETQEQPRGTDVSSLSEHEQARIASQSKLDQLHANSLPNVAPNVHDDIADAEAKGDVMRAIALKQTLPMKSA